MTNVITKEVIIIPRKKCKRGWCRTTFKIPLW